MRRDPPSGKLLLSNESVGVAAVQPSAINSQPHPAIPDYEVMQRIGGGSYGDVWLVRNLATGLLRAAKVVHRRTFEHEGPFKREFNGIKRFEPISHSHESQVKILHVGRNETDGYFYYVMELADDASAECGVRSAESRAPAATAKAIPHSEFRTPHSYVPRTLKLDLQRRGPLPIDECVTIGIALAQALEHLHAHGLVHRDIKPSNIIFVNCVAKLADIGLVTDVDATRSFVGTEGFIPPEGPGTPQADLYSLGKLLYEAAMGRSRLDFPALPANWDAIEPAEQSRLLELNEVLVKTCEADPRRRYQAAEQLHDDLEWLQTGQSLRRKRSREVHLAKIKKLGFAAAVVAGCAAIVLIEKPWFERKRPFADRRQLTSEEKQLLAKHGTTNQQAYEAYQKGRVFLNNFTQEGFAEAVEHLNRAIEMDPNFALAFVTLADAYRGVSDWHLPPRQVMPEAKKNVMRALELDESLVDAHLSLGWNKMHYEWDWPGAERAFRRARELAPTNAITHLDYAWYCRLTGRFEQARVSQNKANELGPLQPPVLTGEVWQLYLERRDSEARRACEKLLLGTNVFGLEYWAGRSYRAFGAAEAIAALRKMRSVSDAPDLIAWQGHILATIGRRDEALQLLTELDNLKSQRYVSPTLRAVIYVGLDEKERAMECLEKAYEERSRLLADIKSDPLWDNVRHHPRFTQLLAKIGLQD